MTDVVGLVLPFFGLIFIGFLVARITRQPIEALGWMTTFVIYVALPALFFQLLAKTPFEQLTEWSFIFGAVFSTYIDLLDDVRRLGAVRRAARSPNRRSRRWPPPTAISAIWGRAWRCWPSARRRRCRSR